MRYLPLVTLCGLTIAVVACSADPAVEKQRYFESGNRYFERGEYPEAIIEYRNAIGIDAAFGEARKRLAESYARTGNDAGALAEFVQAADLLPRDAAVQLNAGKLLLAARQPEEALARAEAALNVEPQNVDALVLRGTTLAGLKSFEEALGAIEQAIHLEPGRGVTYTDLGLVELAQGRREQAEAAFRKAVELSPGDVRAHLALANFYWSLGRTAEAGRAFDDALHADPANVQANRFMASYKYATGRREEAEPYLRRIAHASARLEETLALADYYVLMARPTDAIATLENLQTGREIPAVMLRLARAHAAAGDRQQAFALVERLLGSNSANAAAHLLKGQLLFEDGRREEAFAAVQTATTLDPSSADAHFALGRLYAARGDRAAAARSFNEVIRINPRAAAAQAQLATLQTGNDPQGSVRLAEEATRTDRTSLTARLALVRSLLSAGDLARAERELATLRAGYPDVPGVHVQDATLAMLRKDTAGARAALERADTLAPASLDTLAGFVALELMQNDHAAARSRLEARLGQDSSPDVLMLAGRTYLALKDPAAAERVLLAAIQADPVRNEPYAMLGSMYMSTNRLDEALREYDALSKKQARPVAPLTMTGLILERQGKIEEAMKRYEDVLALDAHAGVASNNLAWLLAERGTDLERALQLAQTAVAAAPDAPEVLDTLGWVYYKKDLPALAVPLFRRASEKQPNVPEYHYHVGLALLKNGDTVAGRAALQHALDLKPRAVVAADIHRALASSQ